MDTTDLKKAHVRGISYENGIPSEILLGYGKRRWNIIVKEIQEE